MNSPNDDHIYAYAANRAAMNDDANRPTSTPMELTVPLDNGTTIRVDQRAPGPARTVAGATGIVEGFDHGEYRVRCGPKLRVRIPAEYVHAT